MTAEPPADPLATQLGTLYPTGYAIAIVADAAAADDAQEALRQAGWSPESVAIVSDRSMLDFHERQKAAQGPLERLGAFFASDEGVALAQYLDFAERGSWFVFVYAPAHDDMRRLASVLEPIQPIAMHYYGENTMTVVLRDSVPQEQRP
jgi:hypothetical protein